MSAVNHDCLYLEASTNELEDVIRIDDDYTQANAKIDRLNALFAGFFGGVGLSGIDLNFSFSDVSFFSLIKSTTLNES